MAFTCTQPGAYRVVYAFEGKTTEGRPLYEELVAYYMVGDSALYDAATHMGIEPASLDLTEPTTRDTTPECAPVTEEPTEEPTSEVEPTTEVSPTKTVSPTTIPNAGKNQSKNGLQDLGLSIGLGSSALGIASYLMHRDGDATPAKPAKPAPAASPVKARETKDTNSEPTPVGASSSGTSGATSGGSSSGKFGGTSGGTSNGASSGAKSGGTKSKPTTSPKPTAAAKPMPAQQAAPVPIAPTQAPQVTYAASTGGLTSGGWLAGFIIGIGVMALLSGLGLFMATARALRQLGVRSQEDEL